MTEGVSFNSHNVTKDSKIEDVNEINQNKIHEKTSGINLSSWFDNVTKPVKFEKLKRNIFVDVVIVGGGIAGYL